MTRTNSDTRTIARVIWENAQFFVLALTIAGQMFVGVAFFIGQGLWAVANIISVIRDFVLRRPVADIVKDSAMTAITIALITLRLLGLY